MTKLLLIDDYFVSRNLGVFTVKLRKYIEEEKSLEITTVRSVGIMLMEK
ncbi:MAG: hypothetical protein LKI39_15140 [Bacteroides sp.]|jgi:DNA-binding response OmpR family regulator|nr:hypothetical protein [Bacteroides sp.]